MSRYFIAFSLLLCAAPAISQIRIGDTTVYDQAAVKAMATFQQAIALQKEIYTGPEYIGYLPAEGFAYFLEPDWQTGTVLYDGILYSDQFLKYDLVKDKLVLKRDDGFGIELRSDKVGYFTLPAHTIIYWNGSIKSNLKPGFYQALTMGRLTVLAKHTKVLEELLQETQLRRRFSGSTMYYAIKDNTVYPVKKLRSVLDLVAEKKGALQQYLKKNKLKFKKNREATLTAVADYYNKTYP